MRKPSIGDEFGRWTVTGEPYRKDGNPYVQCKCTCGTTRDVAVKNLYGEHRSTSCGCYQRERSAEGRKLRVARITAKRAARLSAALEVAREPGPAMPLEAFVLVCCLGPDPTPPAVKKMRWLLDHLTAALQRVPLVADLNALTLASLTFHVRNKLKRSVVTTKGMKQYFRSVWRTAAEMGIVADVPKSATTGGRRASRRKLLTWKMRERIATATRLHAHGESWERIAKRFKLTPEAVFGWRKRWPEVWKAALDKAMTEACEHVRAAAGTDAMLATPNFPQVAANCRRWWQERHSAELFPEPADAKADPSQMTVPQFLESYMLPVCLRDAAAETIGIYRKAANKFATTCGNPPLAKIDNLLLARYVKALQKMAAKGKGGEPLSPHTVKMYAAHLQTILDKAGPPQRRCRDAAGYITSAPWVRPPRTEIGEPVIVPDEVFWRVYDAAGGMAWPHESWATAGDWWQALLVTARFTGLRSRTLFALAWRHVDFPAKRLDLPPSILKNRKRLVLPLAAIVVDHLTPLAGERKLVFDLPASLEFFRRSFHKLQTLAGLDEPQHFGLHSLRRTAITRLWIKSPGAAQLLAGHGSPIITRQSYVNHEAAMQEAVTDMADAAMAGKA